MKSPAGGAAMFYPDENGSRPHNPDNPQSDQQPIDSKEGEIDNTAGMFIFDHDKETETFVPNENFGKPVVSELDQAKTQIAQLEERLKESEIRSVCRWVKASERLPEKGGDILYVVKYGTTLREGAIMITHDRKVFIEYLLELYNQVEWLEEIDPLNPTQS